MEATKLRRRGDALAPPSGARIRYVCGADITFKGDEKYACLPMGIFETAIEAAQCNKGLHPSFGYAIHKVDASREELVTLCSGLMAGKQAHGFRVLETVGQSYEILAAA